MPNDDLSDQISLIEAEIERLARIAEGCRKIILLSKITMLLGGVALAATVFGLFRFNQLALVGSIAAILGGIVAAGSNAATLKKARGDIQAAELLRTKLIDQLEFRP